MNLQKKPQIAIKTESLNGISCLKTIQKNNSLLYEILPPAEAKESSLVFAQSIELFDQAIANGAQNFIITDKILSDVSKKIKPQHGLWTTQNISESMSQVFKLFNLKTFINKGVHPSAYIAKTASIGQNVTVEPFAVIGENAIIGDNTIIGSHSVIENEARIGTNTVLSSHVFVGFNCEVGNNCVVGPQTVFGSDGFGFFTDKTGTHHKITQIGRVVVEDNCEFGSYCVVDRAALTDTRIKKGSKFDNIIHIAHNCEIGDNALITAGFIVAGSTKIGKNLMTAGGVHVNGHVQIPDNVILTARTAVTSTIEKSGVYGGFPETDHKSNLKIMSTLGKLPEMRKQILKILKHLGLNEE